MENEIDLFIQLAFETGQAYQNIYNQIGLDNVIDFNDVALANSKGAQWKFKGDMSDLPELFKIHKLKQNGIDELNKLAQNLQDIKIMAKNIIGGNKNAKNDEISRLG